MKIKFTKKNATLASIVYQAYPITLSLIVNATVEDSKLIGYVGIFVIAEFVLACVLLNWKKKSESHIVDEREEKIRLQVGYLQLKVIEIVLVLSIILSFTLFKEMSAKILLGIMAIPILVGEVYANFKFRKLD